MVSEIRAVTNRLVFYTVRVQGPLGLRPLFVRKGKGPSFVVYNFGGTIKDVDAALIVYHLLCRGGRHVDHQGQHSCHSR